MCRLILKYNTTEEYTRDQEDTTTDHATKGNMTYILVGIGIALVVIPGVIISAVVIKKKTKSNGDNKITTGGNEKGLIGF